MEILQKTLVSARSALSMETCSPVHQLHSYLHIWASMAALSPAGDVAISSSPQCFFAEDGRPIYGKKPLDTDRRFSAPQLSLASF